MNPFGSAGKDDDTLFDGSGLKIKSIKTRRQLNEAEFESILRVTDIWQMQYDQPVTIWPATDLRDTESPIRGDYIAAMKQGDLRNYGPIIDLHKKFSE